MLEIKLRESGIYTLPDGRELIVSRISKQGCSLCTLQTWKSYGIAEYRIHQDGRLLSKGIPTRWRIEDLKDTGRVIK
jgi:hypothetical protein